MAGEKFDSKSFNPQAFVSLYREDSELKEKRTD